MTPVIIYLIKANVALMLLYLVYRLLFRNDTFFELRRFVLLFILFAAFLYQIPDLSNWMASKENFKDVIFYYSGLMLPETEVIADSEANNLSLQALLPMLLTSIYVLGVIAGVIRLFIQLISVIHKRFIAKLIRIDNQQVCLLPGNKTAYSFFIWIFISEEQLHDPALDEVLLHEKTHVSELHSLDLFLAELVCICCWFNPFARLLKKEISINHEFIADQQVLVSGYDKKEYQYALIGMRSPQSQAIASLYNHFSVLLLKKRITMLNKKRTKSIGKAKYLMLIPIFAILLMANNIDAMARITGNKAPAVTSEIIPDSESAAISAIPQTPQDTTVFTVVEDMPQYPGGTATLLNYLAQNIKYPEKAQKEGVQGRVMVHFIINKDGSISDVTVVPDRGISPELDAEAIRVVEAMPNWTPGKQRGVPVRVKYTLPVTFKLQ